MSDSAVVWATTIMRTYWADQGSLALFVLAKSADDDGLVAHFDCADGLQSFWIEPEALLTGMMILEDDGLIDAGLRRPRDAARMYVVGPVRLHLEREWKS
jgi:hypothetical protein